MHRTLARSPVCDQYPEAFRYGQLVAEQRLHRLRVTLGLFTSSQIRQVIHGGADYAYLDSKLGRGHTYEEGIAFVQGFYDTLDVARDFAAERET